MIEIIKNYILRKRLIRIAKNAYKNHSGYLVTNIIVYKGERYIVNLALETVQKCRLQGVIFMFSYDNLRECDYFTYCKTCKHFDKEENEEPCDECLEACMNEGTNKPRLWEEKK